MEDHIKRVGLLGGTFDPIHLGHIHLAIELKERGLLDEIWFIPAYCSPLPLKPLPLSALHRRAMVQLAIQDIPHFHLRDEELVQQKPSYTIETILQLRTLYPQHLFSLLLGEDAALLLNLWRAPEKILSHVKLLIGYRYRREEFIKRLEEREMPAWLQREIQESLMPTPLWEISSSLIRERVQKKLYCGHLLPVKVLDYIYENQLYSYIDKC